MNSKIVTVHSVRDSAIRMIVWWFITFWPPLSPTSTVFIHINLLKWINRALMKVSLAINYIWALQDIHRVLRWFISMEKCGLILLLPARTVLKSNFNNQTFIFRSPRVFLYNVFDDLLQCDGRRAIVETQQHSNNTATTQQQHSNNEARTELRVLTQISA